MSELLSFFRNRSQNNFFCKIRMPSEETKMSEFNQYQKSDKAPFIIYADFERIIDKIHLQK